MGVYDRQIATARRLITRAGQVVTWRQVTDGEPPDPAKPWLAGDTETDDHSVSIVFLPEDRKGYEFLALMAQTEIPKGKLVGYMAAQDFEPALKDVVVRDGVEYAIRTLDPINPNGQTILYVIGFDV